MSEHCKCGAEKLTQEIRVPFTMFRKGYFIIYYDVCPVKHWWNFWKHDES
jgi:hypothetical protein